MKKKAESKKAAPSPVTPVAPVVVEPKAETPPVVIKSSVPMATEADVVTVDPTVPVGNDIAAVTLPGDVAAAETLTDAPRVESIPKAALPPQDDGLADLLDEDEDEEVANLLSALAHPKVKGWIETELAKADYAMRMGPDGAGWKFNESLREETEAFHLALSFINDRIQEADRPMVAPDLPGESGRVAALKHIIEIGTSGFGGVLPTGGIVDRREFPEAIAIQENPMMGVPAPLEIN